jgi:hypothetical protein
VSARGASRWEANVQYYKYTSDTLRREPTSDEYVVAEAFIYDMQKEEVTTAITVVASAKYRAQLPTQSHVVDDGARIYLFTVDLEMPAAFPSGRASPAILRYDLTGRLDTTVGRFDVKKTGARKLLLIAVFLAVLGLTLPIAILALM